MPFLVAAGHINDSLQKHLDTKLTVIYWMNYFSEKAAFQPADIVQYKSINQSNRPKTMKKWGQQKMTMKERLDKLKDLIAKINLSDPTIEYHSQWASIAVDFLINESF